MDDAIIHRWNDAVKSTDLVYVLGHFGTGSLETLAEYRRKLHGKICFIRHKDDPFFSDLLQLGFDSIATEVVIDYKTWQFTLTAEPKDNSFFSEESHGLINLHGHVVGRQRVVGSRVDVSTDAWDFTPTTMGTRTHPTNSTRPAAGWHDLLARSATR